MVNETSNNILSEERQSSNQIGPSTAMAHLKRETTRRLPCRGCPLSWGYMVCLQLDWIVSGTILNHFLVGGHVQLWCLGWSFLRRYWQVLEVHCIPTPTWRYGQSQEGLKNFVLRHSKSSEGNVSAQPASVWYAMISFFLVEHQRHKRTHPCTLSREVQPPSKKIHFIEMEEVV